MATSLLDPESQKTSFAERLYGRCIRLYPAAFRREFETEMQVTFRALWRAAAQDPGRLARLRLVGHTLLDLVISLPQQHAQALRQNPLSVTRLILAFTSTWMLIILASLIVGLTVVISCALPDRYVATSNLAVVDRAESAGGAELNGPSLEAWMRSPGVLGVVADELNLAVKWRSPSADTPLPMSDVLKRLNASFVVEPFRNDTPQQRLYQIRVWGTNALAPADLANRLSGVAMATFQQLRAAGTAPAGAELMIVDRAVPGLRPIAPNRRLNIALAVFSAALLCGALKAIGWLIRRWFQAAGPVASC